MKFLRQLLLRCTSWIIRVRRKASDRTKQERQAVPRVLASDDLVTRFVYSERNIRKAQARPKPGAFNPSPYTELSVVHSSGLPDDEIWDTGRQTLGTEQGRNKIYGRADVPVQSFHDVKLRALRDDNPFKRHTSVKDWPIGSDGGETKAIWKQITLELSEDLRISLAFPNALIEHPK
jgi:hypothetical protein